MDLENVGSGPLSLWNNRSILPAELLWLLSAVKVIIGAKSLDNNIFRID